MVASSSKKKAKRGPTLDPHQVILTPLITEKGTHQSTHENHNAYSFQVNIWATKSQIRVAVAELFNVRVEKVRTQMRLGKKRRYRFRFLDGSNARFYRMFLENMVTTTPGPVFWQIGNRVVPRQPVSVPQLRSFTAPGRRVA